MRSIDRRKAGYRRRISDDCIMPIYMLCTKFQEPIPGLIYVDSSAYSFSLTYVRHDSVEYTVELQALDSGYDVVSA